MLAAMSHGLTTVDNGILTIQNALGLGYADGNPSSGVLVNSTLQASGTLQVADPAGLGFVIQGRPLTDRPFHGGGAWLTVSPGYFEVFRIPIRRGRSSRSGRSGTHSFAAESLYAAFHP